MTPRPYLSYSQLTLFERSAEQYRKVYLLGEAGFSNGAMDFGSAFAKTLEDEEASGDALTDLVASHMPMFGLREHQTMAKIRVGKKLIPVIAKMDTCSLNLDSIGEYKTGTGKWTQGKVDRSDQITFYSMVAWLTVGHIPSNLLLAWAQTVRSEDGSTRFTGKIETFHTKRHMGDILRMMERCKRAWGQIERMSAEATV